MIDIQQLVNTMNDISKDTRAKYHLTLGQLINYLEQCKPSQKVFCKVNNLTISVDVAHSYRGYYSDLALSPTNKINTVGDLLNHLDGVLNQELEGYKGGEFLMTENTPLWLSDYGENSGLAIIEIRVVNNAFENSELSHELVIKHVE